MALLQTPQSQAGVMSFYDAPTKGPRINPKIIVIVVASIAIIILILNHFIYY